MLGSIIGSIGTAIGGIFGANKSAKAAAKAQRRQEQLQYDFAQKGIRWRVADAKAAGIHPLYALGASGAQYTPVSTTPDYTSMGQSIGRAAMAAGSAIDRHTAQKYQAQVHEETLRGLRLDNDGKQLNNQLMASKIATTQVAGTPAAANGIPLLPGQSQSGVTPVTMEQTMSKPGSISQEAGAAPSQRPWR